MAAGSTYTPIATTTLGSSAATYTFSSISGGYTDLVLITNVSTVTGNQNMNIVLNGDTGTNYSDTELSGNGTSATSIRDTNAPSLPIDNVAYAQANFNNIKIINFMNYSNTTTYKTVLVRSNNAATGVDASVSMWRSTAAITSIAVRSTGTFAAGSTFTLYGISCA